MFIKLGQRIIISALGSFLMLLWLVAHPQEVLAQDEELAPEDVNSCKVIAEMDPTDWFVLGYTMGFGEATDLAYGVHVGFTSPRERRQRIGVVAFEFQATCAENPEKELFQAMIDAYGKLIDGGYTAAVGCEEIPPREGVGGCTRRTIENP